MLSDNRFPPWLARLRSVRPLTMVSLGRLLLSLFATLSVYADPGQPTGDTALTYQVLAAYIFFAVAAMILSLGGVRNPRLRAIAHVVDITFFAVLIHLTDGVASPFFVYFTFVLFTAAIGWGWRGAAITTMATVAVFLFLTVLDSADLRLHIDRIIVRTSYLVFAGIFFCYFAAIAEASRLRLARLADWPETTAEQRQPAIAGILAHAAEILKLSRIIVLWQQDGALQAAAFRGGDTTFGRIPKEAGPYRDTGPAIVSVEEEVRSLLDPLPGPLRSEEYGAERGVVVPLPEHGSGSCVILLGRRRFGRDFLPLASIVATRIAAELKQHDLRKRLISTAAAEERAKLAQDVHDDILQSLTAVALRLKNMEARLPAETAEQISAVRALVTLHQRRLRDLVMGIQADSRDAGRYFGERLQALVSMLQVQWECSIEFDFEWGRAPLSETTMKNIELFVAEAVANGVRHGNAKRFKIDLQVRPDHLGLGIRDDGRGIAGSTGAYDHEAVMDGRLGSASLRQRAEASDWRIQLMTSARGTHILVQIPLGS